VVVRQALGRLPWLAAFFLRPRRLRPRLLIVVSSFVLKDPVVPGWSKVVQPPIVADRPEHPAVACVTQAW